MGKGQTLGQGSGCTKTLESRTLQAWRSRDGHRPARSVRHAPAVGRAHRCRICRLEARSSCRLWPCFGIFFATARSVMNECPNFRSGTSVRTSGSGSDIHTRWSSPLHTRPDPPSKTDPALCLETVESRIGITSRFPFPAQVRCRFFGKGQVGGRAAGVKNFGVISMC